MLKDWGSVKEFVVFQEEANLDELNSQIIYHVDNEKVFMVVYVLLIGSYNVVIVFLADFGCYLIGILKFHSYVEVCASGLLYQILHLVMNHKRIYFRSNCQF